MISLLLWLSAALAARHEISADTGGTVITDGPATSVLDFGSHTAQPGLRVGVAVMRDRQRFGLVVGGSWNRASQYGDGAAYYDEEGYSDGIDLRTIVDRWGVNLKADYDLVGVVFPYVRTEARLAHAATRTSAADGGLTTSQRGLTGGGMFTGGFEFMVPDERLHIPVTVAVYVEGGYEAVADLKLGDLGTINLSGAVVRGGLGLRF
jgi:hypothetical protein